MYYLRAYTYQHRCHGRQYGPYPADHGAHGHHGGPHLRGKDLGGQHVDDGKRDGYREFTQHEQRQPYQRPFCFEKRKQTDND